MSEAAIKKRLDRAKQKAMKDLGDLGYTIFPSDNKQICFIAARPNEVRFIRICIDKITDMDRRVIKETKLSGVCLREIWLKKKDQDQFEIHKF